MRSLSIWLRGDQIHLPHWFRNPSFCFLTSSSSFSSSPLQDGTKHHSSQQQLQSKKPVLWWERLQSFPKNVQRLSQDYSRIKDMHDAAKTPRTAWTKRFGCLGRIPRRHLEEEQQVYADLKIVLPILLLWLPPVIGNFPLVLVLFLPRQLLCRQFWNTHEKNYFTFLEYTQRQKYYDELSLYFSSSLSLDRSDGRHFQQSDSAGPIGDLTIYWDSWSGIQTHSHWQTLALAIGFAQRFPPPIPEISASMASLWIKRSVQKIANRIGLDDRNCIEENYHLDTCSGMTDDEVREACRLRGLPVNITYDEMRECMTNHLIMVDDLRQKRGKEAPDEKLNLFVLHLPAIRKVWKDNE
jgi:LETM1-like protein